MSPTDPSPADPTAPDTPPTPTADPRQDWLEWHRTREEELTRPTGWLSLTSLTWLGTTPVGVPDFPASWTATPLDEGDTPGVFRVRFEPGQDIDFTRDAAPVTGPHEWVLGPGEDDTSLARGEVVAEVARRGDGVCVRVRDPHAPTLTGFHGVPVWDFDPEWIRPATLDRFEESLPRTVRSAQPGRTTTLTSLGRLHVSLPDGSTGDLDLIAGGHGWSVVFHDPTNGVESSAWRTAPVLGGGTGAGTPEDEGDLLVDFNRSSNFPAHFTPFGTCPTPPEHNILDLPVRAGEKAPLRPVD